MILLLRTPARDRVRPLVSGRAWNIALRTAHIATMGILLGGHAFNLPPEKLWLSLWLTIGTGAGLGAIEAGPRLLWFHQGRGLMTLAKLGSLCAVPFLWEHWYLRLAVLLVVVALASIGSHMPARFRYYSVIYRKVILCGSGPGVSRRDEPIVEDSIAEGPGDNDGCE